MWGTPPEVNSFDKIDMYCRILIAHVIAIAIAVLWVVSKRNTVKGFYPKPGMSKFLYMHVN